MHFAVKLHRSCSELQLVPASVRTPCRLCVLPGRGSVADETATDDRDSFVLANPAGVLLDMTMFVSFRDELCDIHNEAGRSE